MRKTQAERIREWKRRNNEPIRIGEDGKDPAVGLAEIMMGGPLEPTQLAFFNDPSRHVAYMGPQGCGKSFVCCAAGLSRALWIPGSVGMIAQHDYTDLMKSTYVTFKRLLDRLPVGIVVSRNKSPPMELEINPIGGGEPSKIFFMGLKDNLGGFEMNWAFLDEADKIDKNVATLVDGRLRYPGGGYKMMLAFNPPDKHNWLYTACTGRNYRDAKVGEPWLKLYRPKKGENAKNLPAGYYEKLRASYSPDMIERLIEGEWMSTFDGQPVYPEFSKTHQVGGLISKYDPFRPIIRFWDFGYQHPYCGWGQMDWEGRFLVFHELLGTNIEATAFARKCKAETARLFPQATDFTDFGDPAVAQQKDTGKTLAEFAKEGITIRYKRSTIDEGVRAVRQGLSQMIRGEPSIQIDPSSCPILCAALRGGYRLKEGVGNDRTPKPFKDGFYDHPADAFRYGIIHVFGSYAKSNYTLPESIEYVRGRDTI